MNKDDYLNKVTEFLVEDTTIDIKFRNITFPYSTTIHLSYSSRKKSDMVHVFSYMFRHDLFYRYCKDNYGLSHEESMRLFHMYKIKIVKKMFDLLGS